MIMLHGRRALPKDNIVSFSRYKRDDSTAGMPNAEPSDVEYLNRELDYLKFRLSIGSGVCFPFITDIHPDIIPSVTTNYGWNQIYKNFSIYKKETTKRGGRYVYNSGEKMDSLERATAVLLKLAETNRMDCCVLGGDYGGANGSLALTKEQFLKILGGQSEIMSKISRRMPVIVCKGNHDSNAFNQLNNTAAGKSLNMVSSDAYSNGDQNIFPSTDYPENEYKKHCINYFLSFSSDVVYGDANKTYGYYDIKDKKVRILFLNVYDYDFTTVFDASHAGDWFIGEEQLKFIANSALKFDTGQTGWNIMLCCHWAIFNSGGISEDYRKDVFKMFISFQHGLGGTFPAATWSGEGGSVQIKLFDYDFTDNKQNGNIKNKIYCGFCGHIHASNFPACKYSVSGNNITIGVDDYRIVFVQVDAMAAPACNGMIYNTNSPDYRKYIPAGQEHNRGYVHKALFDIIQFDPATNKLYCHRYGFGESRYFTRDSNGFLLMYSKNVTITVKDAVNKTAISDATVTIALNGGDIVGTTNSSGQVSFGSIPYDKFDINVIAEGYQNYTETIGNINANLTNKIIELIRNE